ncbi:hypothetical protein ABND66_10140 [Paenibacillus larvae]
MSPYTNSPRDRDFPVLSDRLLETDTIACKGNTSSNPASCLTPSDWQRELLAGTVSFFAAVYIIIDISSILMDAGIPQEAGIIATILASAVGCFIMGL